jgi:hypothetical protein
MRIEQPEAVLRPDDVAKRLQVSRTLLLDSRRQSEVQALWQCYKDPSERVLQIVRRVRGSEVHCIHAGKYIRIPQKEYFRLLNVKYPNERVV